MTAQPLYAVSDAYLEILHELEDNGGELTPDLQNRLTAITGTWQEKVERVALYIQNLLALSDAATTEKKRLERLAMSRWDAASDLKDYLKREMQRLGEKRVITPLVTVRIQANSRPSIRWTGAGDPPRGFQRTIPARVELDADLALAEWKATGQLPEGFSVETSEHLRIV